MCFTFKDNVHACSWGDQFVQGVMFCSIRPDLMFKTQYTPELQNAANAARTAICCKIK